MLKMIQRCIFVFSICFLLQSCNLNKDSEIEYELFDLKIVDTLIVSDDFGFFHKPSKSSLSGDSLLITSSLLSGFSIYDLYEGKQKFLLSMNNKFGISFFVSSHETNKYPLVQLLDSRKQSIHIINVEKESYEGKISLSVPNGFSIKLLDPVFELHNDKYFVELMPDGVSITDKDFYRLSEKYIGIFDSSGNLINRFLEYPNNLSSAKGFVNPLKYHNLSFYDDIMLAAFPFEGLIRLYHHYDQDPYSIINLPKFQNLDFDLIFNKQEFDPRDVPIEKTIDPALFDAVYIKGRIIYISTFVNDNSNFDQYKVNTNVLIYNIDEDKWKMSKEMNNYWQLGKLAGIVGDTLYFFEASLIESDDKRIYRAVIKE